MNEDDAEGTDAEHLESLGQLGVVPSNTLLTLSVQTLAMLLVLRSQGGFSDLVAAFSLGMDNRSSLMELFQSIIRLCFVVVVTQAVASIVLALALVRLQAPWLRRNTDLSESLSLARLIARGVAWSLGILSGYVWWRTSLRFLLNTFWGETISLPTLDQGINSAWAFMSAGCTMLILVLFPFTRIAYRKRWWR